MTIHEIKDQIEHAGISLDQLSSLSGIPISILRTVLEDNIPNPPWYVLPELERTLSDPYTYRQIEKGWIGSDNHEDCVREGALAFDFETSNSNQGKYTLKDYYALPDTRRIELIDGSIYDMGAPSVLHQAILGQLHLQLAPCVERHPECELFLSPCDVRLDNDDKTMVQPDLFIACHAKEEDPRRFNGAPDYIVEILSASSRRHDMQRKLYKYAYAGVKEYWIVDPQSQKVIVYDLAHDDLPKIYSFNNVIPVLISDGNCSVDFQKICQKVRHYLTPCS